MHGGDWRPVFSRPELRRFGWGEYFRVDSLGKGLVVVGLTVAIVGAVFWLLGRGDGALLPGDIVVEKKNGRFHFPIVTCLVISVVLSVIAWLFRR